MESDIQQGLNLISQYQEKQQASTETMLQDFLRWGPFGVLANVYLTSISRIKRVTFPIQKAKEADFSSSQLATNWSIYLPKPDEFDRLVKALESLRQSIIKVTKDKSMKPDDVVDKLNRLGIDCKYNGSVKSMITTDWGCVAGSWALSMIWSLCLLFCPAGSIIGSIFGTYYGGAIGSKNVQGKGLLQNGWTAKKIIEASKVVYQTMLNIEALENVKPLDESRKLNDYEFRVKFIKKATEVYTETACSLGRGLCAAINLAYTK